MQTLRPLLPIEYQSSVDADVTFRVRALDSVYTRTASSSTIKGYLEELQAIANKSGKSFQEVLQEELIKISMVKGVDLPAEDKTTPAADSEPECHHPPKSSESTGTCQEAEEVKVPT